MKKFTFLLTLILAFTGYSWSQIVEDYEHIDLNWFEAGAEGYMHVVPNPDPAGNSSAYVVEFRRGADGQPFAGFFSRLPEPLDLTEHKYVYVDVWKPVISPVVFKLEPDDADNIEIPSMFPQTKVNEWETMVFDFSEQDGLFEVITFFPDFPETVEHEEDIFIYFDNIRVGGPPEEPEEGVFLAWNIGSSASTPEFRDEYYSVWISTTGTNPEDFTMVFDETLPTDVDGWAYQPREIDISEYAGEDIYVTFRHHESTDNDRLVLYDVKLYEYTTEEKTEIVYFSEDFTDGVDHEDGIDWLPDGWVAVDNDGDEYNWYFEQFEGDGYMLSKSWDDGTPLNPDNWLITPSITLDIRKTAKQEGYVVEDFEFITMNIMLGGEEDNSNFRIIPNPDPADVNLSSHVVRFHRSQFGVPWGGFFSPLPEPVNMDENKYVLVDVWKPRISPIKFKVEGGPGGTFELESIEPQTKVEEWETMVFHFPEADGDYPIIAFMPDFEDPLALDDDIVIYFDNIRFSSTPTSSEEPVYTENEITIFPNPANQIVNVSAEANAEVALYDITGNLINKKVAGIDSVTFDVSELAKGIYLIKVTQQGETFSGKLLVY
ncbi:MAG: choice-of-anchor J domain-containing protein [Bacteroidales bacterium]